MKVGPLSLFHRTSSRWTLNVASWHSPHSLTWRWIFSAGLQRIVFERPRGMWKTVGPHVYRCGGVGSLLGGYAMRHNGGWQFGLTVLGLALTFSQQQPMWFRDLYHRQQRERSSASEASRKAERSEA